MEAWPSDLPQWVKRDVEMSPRCGMNSFDEGLNPQRIRTYPEEETTVRTLMTLTQLASFRTFHDTTLNGGCAPFTAPWLESLGYEFHFVRFTAAPGIDCEFPYWWVTMPLEIIAGVETDESGDTAIWAE